MQVTLAIDVYGTLINTNIIADMLGNMVGGKAQDFSCTWRNKQLEYAFRRGLMKNYEPFSVCTVDALDYTCAYYNLSLSNKQKNDLINEYKQLPAFSEVRESLEKFKSSGFRIYAFSNGTSDSIETLLSNAKIRDFFNGIVTVDDIKSFKPDPAVYCHFLRKAKASSGDAWLISGNPFDVIGAISAGMKSAWIKRYEDLIFDPWDIKPDIIATDLDDLYTKITH